MSCLGKVIKALAEKAEGKGAKASVVPYRESKLTLMLKTALGGIVKPKW